jgi:UDP-N-acetyl-D-glucosamine dehydrogenase
MERLCDMDAISVCVPTPLSKTRDPDMSAVLSAADDIAKRLRPGQVIVLESTTYPGTTREIFLPRISEQGFKIGHDVFLAFSPERVDPGRLDWTAKNTPKVMGGITPACLQARQALVRISHPTCRTSEQPRSGRDRQNSSKTPSRLSTSGWSTKYC